MNTKRTHFMYVFLLFSVFHMSSSTLTASLAGQVSGKYIRIRSYQNNNYLAARWIKNRWRLTADTDDPNDPATKFRIIRHKKRRDRIGFVSHITGDRRLQGSAKGRDKEVKFENHNFKSWEQWELKGSSLDNCGIWAIGAKHFLEISSRKWGINNLAWANAVSDRATNAQFSIEIVSYAPFKRIYQVSGSFKQIAAGNNYDVWAVNKNNNVYRLAPTQVATAIMPFKPLRKSWQSVPGKLKQVSVGSDGTVWGVSPNNDVYMWNGIKFVKIRGKLKQISVGSKNNVCGIGTNNQVYKWNRKKKNWSQLPKVELVVEVKTPYRRVGRLFGTPKKTFKTVTGTLKQVSIGEDGVIFGVTTDNSPCQLEGKKWIMFKGLKIKQVSAAHQNNIFGISTNDKVSWFNGKGFVEIAHSRFWLSESKPKFKYAAAGGGIYKNGISLWLIDTNNKIYEALTYNWSYLPGNLKQVSVGDEKNIWGVTRRRATRYWKDNRWHRDTSRPLSSVNVASDGKVWGLVGDVVYERRSHRNWQLNKKAKLREISVGSTNNVWGIGKNKRLYKWDGRKWRKKHGKKGFKDVSVAYDGTVYAIRESKWGRHRDQDKLYRITDRRADRVLSSPWDKAKFRQISIAKNKTTNKISIWGTSHANDLIEFDPSNNRSTYYPGGYKHVSVGDDGTVWATTLSDLIVEIRPRPSIQAKKQAIRAKEKAERAKIDKFNKYTNDLNKVKKQTDINSKINALQKLTKDAVSGSKYYDPYMFIVNDIVYNRRKENLKKLQGLLDKLISEYEYLEETFDRYGAKAAKKFTEFDKKKISTDLLKNLKDLRKTAEKPIDHTELFKRATTGFKDLVNKSKTVREGTTQYNKFIQQTNKWLNGLEELVDMMKDHPEIPLKQLVVTPLKKTDKPSTIKEHLDAFSPWTLKLKPIHRTRLRNIVNKVETFVPPTVVAPKVIAKPDVIKEVSPIQFIGEKPKPAVPPKKITPVAKPTVEPSVPPETILIAKPIPKPAPKPPAITPELLSKTLTNTTDNIFVAADQPGSTQDLWFKNFRILITNIVKLPIDKIDAYKDLLVSIEESKDYFTFPAGKESLKQSQLNKLLKDGKKYYIKIANDVNGKIRPVGLKKISHTDWLARLKYLHDDIANRNPEELLAIQKLLKTMDFYERMYRRTFRNNMAVKNEIDALVKGMRKVAFPAPHKEAFEKALAATAFLGDTGKIALYKQAVEKVTKEVPLEERSSLIKTHFEPLLSSALKEENIKTNLEALTSINELFTTMQTTFNKDLTKAEQETITSLVAPLINKVSFLMAIVTAQQEQDFNKQLESYKKTIEAAPTTLTDQDKIDFVNDFIRPLVTKSIADETINKNLTHLKALQEILTMTKSYNEEVIDMSLNEINEIITTLEKEAAEKLAAEQAAEEAKKPVAKKPVAKKRKKPRPRRKRR